MWQTVNEVSGRKTTSKSKLKASSEQERLSLWKEQFQNLPGKATVVSDSPVETINDHEFLIKLGNFTLDELSPVLKKLKNGKAAGLDDVPPEAWKSEKFNDILLDLQMDGRLHSAISREGRPWYSRELQRYYIYSDGSKRLQHFAIEPHPANSRSNTP